MPRLFGRENKENRRGQEKCSEDFLEIHYCSAVDLLQGISN